MHSDLLNFNLLIANDRVSAVLDWGSSMYGDVLWDLAWFRFWQPWYPAWQAIDFREEALHHAPEEAHFDARLRCYELCIGVDGLAYQAFRERWDHIEATSRRIFEVLTG